MIKGQCLATKAIMEENAKVGYMFREAADFPEDSGWRIFTGEESLDFVDKEDNIEIYDLSRIAGLDASITTYLESPVGSEWERVPSTDEFIAVKTKD